MHEYHTNSQKYDAQRWATAFVEAGINVLQLWPMDAAGRCTCWRESCSDAGKHRVHKKEATPDFRERTDLFEWYLEDGEFDSGYGVLLDQSGLLVVDVDARNGGIDAFERLAAKFPEVRLSGFIVTTGSGGGSRHLYFRLPEGVEVRSKLAGYDGIDFKSSGFVIGPGSRHKSGGVYAVALGDLDDIEEAPAALVAALEKRKFTPKVSSIPTGSVDIEIVAEELRDLPADDRNIWLSVGATLQAEYGDAGFDLWDQWSATAKNYPEDSDTMGDTWESLANKASALETLFELCEAYRVNVPFAEELRAETDRIIALEGSPGADRILGAEFPAPEIFQWLPYGDTSVGEGGTVVIRTTDKEGRAHGYHCVGGDWQERTALEEDWVRLPGTGAPEIRSNLADALGVWRATGRAMWIVGDLMVSVAEEQIADGDYA
ncbi:bifunctional DNA primase/polymerase [Cognatishimia sp.]|uniref:bifunctional DNA primase/polymerase n=1 Tax=Cognatishimia sp. TaxID=2211648 RepID=UPI0035152545|nr:bifunctional DNA primase/polymerase [Cognatishimia sp.]